MRQAITEATNKTANKERNRGEKLKTLKKYKDTIKSILAASRYTVEIIILNIIRTHLNFPHLFPATSCVSFDCISNKYRDVFLRLDQLTSGTQKMMESNNLKPLRGRGWVVVVGMVMGMGEGTQL